MLQLRVLGLDGVASAAGAQTGQREVVVQSDHPFRVVEALDVLVRLGEVLRAVHVLQHVHVPTREDSRIREIRVSLARDPDYPWERLMETVSDRSRRERENDPTNFNYEFGRAKTDFLLAKFSDG